MSYPERLLTDDEVIIDQFNPHWRVLLLPMVWTVIAVSLLSAIGFGIDSGSVQAVIAIIIVITWAFLAVDEALSWWFTNYILTNERLVIRMGILKRQGNEIPLESIDNVLFEQTVFERMLGYGDLTIESAQGTNRYDNIPRPEDFQSLIYSFREKRTIHLESGGVAPIAGIAPRPESPISPVVAAASAAPRDRVAQLQSLVELHERGALSDDEFAEAKRKMLNDI